MYASVIEYKKPAILPNYKNVHFWIYEVSRMFRLDWTDDHKIISSQKKILKLPRKLVIVSEFTNPNLPTVQVKWKCHDMVMWPLPSRMTSEPSMYKNWGYLYNSVAYTYLKIQFYHLQKIFIKTFMKSKNILSCCVQVNNTNLIAQF